MSGWCGMKEEITLAKRGQVTSKQGIRGDSGNPPFQWSPWIRNNHSRKYTNQSIGGWKEIISIPIYIFQNILLNFYHMCLYYTFHIRTVSTYTFLKEKNLNALAAFYFHEYTHICVENSLFLLEQPQVFFFSAAKKILTKPVFE